MYFVRNVVIFTFIILPLISLITSCSDDDNHTPFDKEGVPVGSSTRASVIQQMADDFSAKIREDEVLKGDWYRVNFFYTTCRPEVLGVYRVGYFELLQDHRRYNMPIKESIHALFHDEHARERDFETWFVRPLVTYTDKSPYAQNRIHRIYHPDLNKQCDLSSQKLEEAYKEMIADDMIDDAEFDRLKTIYLAEKKIIKNKVVQIQKSIDDEFRAKKQKVLDDENKAKEARENGAGVVFYK